MTLQAWPILLFWPAIALGVVLVGRGIAAHSVGVTLAGAAFTLPGSLYLAASPAVGLAGLLPFLSLVACGWLVRRRQRRGAYLVLALVVGYFVVIAVRLYLL